jgi:hypothetical protein
LQNLLSSVLLGAIRCRSLCQLSPPGSGIRFQPPTVPLQQGIDVTENHPGACPHVLAGVLHSAAIPVTAHIDQNVVGL